MADAVPWPRPHRGHGGALRPLWAKDPLLPPVLFGGSLLRGASLPLVQPVPGSAAKYRLFHSQMTDLILGGWSNVACWRAPHIASDGLVTPGGGGERLNPGPWSKSMYFEPNLLPLPDRGLEIFFFKKKFTTTTNFFFLENAPRCAEPFPLPLPRLRGGQGPHPSHAAGPLRWPASDGGQAGGRRPAFSGTHLWKTDCVRNCGDCSMLATVVPPPRGVVTSFSVTNWFIAQTSSPSGGGGVSKSPVTWHQQRWKGFLAIFFAGVVNFPLDSKLPTRGGG